VKLRSTGDSVGTKVMRNRTDQLCQNEKNRMSGEEIFPQIDKFPSNISSFFPNNRWIFLKSRPSMLQFPDETGTVRTFPKSSLIT
jgi:hypothetical protein